SASFWRDFTFFTCMPAALTPTTLPLLTSAKTSTLPAVWILCLPFCLILSPSRSFPLRWCFSLASVMPEAPMVLADAIIPSAVRRLIIGLLSFFSFCGIFKLWIVRGRRGLCECVAIAAIILTTTAAIWLLRPRWQRLWAGSLVQARRIVYRIFILRIIGLAVVRLEPERKNSPTSTIYGARLPGLHGTRFQNCAQPNRAELNSYTAKPPAKPQRLKA